MPTALEPAPRGIRVNAVSPGTAGYITGQDVTVAGGYGLVA